jgi:uncharacterized paraquat-inducible protein A
MKLSLNLLISFMCSFITQLLKIELGTVSKINRKDYAKRFKQKNQSKRKTERKQKMKSEEKLILCSTCLGVNWYPCCQETSL